MDPVDAVRNYYDEEVVNEWNRIEGRPEFLLTCRYLSRYIRPGDRVLDIGGGPGRYALWLAEQGCHVTLLDLSPENVRFAKAKAAERGLPLHTMQGDARFADAVVKGHFDHVLLMGPLYHLQQERDRVQAVTAALQLLRPNGMLFATFINLYSGLIYAMKFDPACILDPSEHSLAYLQAVQNNQSIAGTLFTEAFFIKPGEVLPFMAQFPLETLHLFGQEGITAPCEKTIMSQSEDVVKAWLDLSEKLAHHKALLPFAEHFMYIGRKQ